MNTNYKRNRRLALIVFPLLCALIAVLYIGKLNARPTVTIVSDKENATFRIGDKSYPIGSKKAKIVLEKGVFRYQAASQNGLTIEGIINTGDDKRTDLQLEFSKLELETIYKESCGDPGAEALFCQKNISDLKYSLIDNNSWALITDSTGYAEAVHQTVVGWRFAQISQSDIYGKQYPKGLEKAAREYE